MLLRDLCQISSGFTARGRLQAVSTGGLLAVQLRDVEVGRDLDAGSLARYQLDDIPDRYLIRGGEVLFRSRGDHNTAAFVDGPLREAAVVVLPLVILRPHTGMILPEYLAWAINQPKAQRHLDAEAQGTNIRMVPKAVLERINIPLPDLKAQSRTVAIYQLARREGALLRNLADRREQLAGLILNGQATLARKKGLQQ